MKKVITGLLVLLCISALTGCGKDDVTLTNEDNDLVAEYIAGTLLIHMKMNGSIRSLIQHRMVEVQQVRLVYRNRHRHSLQLQDIIIQYRLLRCQVIQRTHQQIY